MPRISLNRGLSRRISGSLNRFGASQDRDAALRNVLSVQAQRNAIAFEKEQLRTQADAQRAAMTRTPTVRIVQNPFTQSVAELNADTKSPQLANPRLVRGGRGQGFAQISEAVQPGEQPQTQFQIDAAGELTGRVGGRELTQEEIRRRSQFVRGTPQTFATPLSQFKQEFLNNVPNISEEAKAALLPLVQDENTTVKDFAIRAEQFRIRPARAPQTELDLSQQIRIQERAIRDEISDIDSKLGAIEAILDENNISFRERPLGLLGEAIRSEFSGEDSVRLQRLAAERARLLREKETLRESQRSLVSPNLQSPGLRQEELDALQDREKNPDNSILDQLGF